jgi:hypothetical protein
VKSVLTSDQESSDARVSKRTVGIQKAPAQSGAKVDAAQSLYLVRSTLLTVNDANHSGNYTVLRDLSGPDLQAKSTAADLSQHFADLRQRNFDLFAAALLAPEFVSPPVVSADGRIRLKGFFPTLPLRIGFDLDYIHRFGASTPPKSMIPNDRLRGG